MEKDRSRNVYISSLLLFSQSLSNPRLFDQSLLRNVHRKYLHWSWIYIDVRWIVVTVSTYIYNRRGPSDDRFSAFTLVLRDGRREKRLYVFPFVRFYKKSTQKTRILARRMNRVTVKNDPSTRSSLSRGTTSVFTLCLVSSSPPVAHLSLIFPRIKSRTRECNAAILYSLLFLEGIHVVSPFSSIFRRLSFFLSSLLNHPMIVERESGK